MNKNNLKKIAIYHNVTSGGTKREIFEFTNRFRQNNYTIHLYCHYDEKETYLELTKLVHETYVFPIKFIQKITFTLPLFKSLINYIIDIINIKKLERVSKNMAYLIDKGNYEFVFVHHNKDYVQSPFILRYLETKSIYFCAEPFRKFYEKGISSEIELNNQKTGLINIYTMLTDIIDKPCRKSINNRIKRYDYENIQKSNLILTNSYFSRENILAAYGLNSKVVHLGGDSFQNIHQSHKFHKQNTIISIGAINGLKGYDFIIKSLGTIKTNSRPNFIVVGNGAKKTYVKNLQYLANKLGVVLNIFENVADEKLCDLIQKSTLFVYAPHLEPFGLAPLEAMSFGLPVVAVKEGGPRESIVDGFNGFLEERNPTSFGEKINLLLQDSSLKDNLSKGAIKSISSYWNWDMAFQRLLLAIK